VALDALFGAWILGSVVAAPPAATSPQSPAAREVFGAVELRWNAPPSCPDAAELRRRVERDTTAPIPLDLPLSIVVDAVVTSRPDGRVTMTARTSSATGATERTWIADACETLAEVTVVLLASAIERAHATLDAEADPPETTPPEREAAPPVPATTQPRVEAQPRDPRPRSRAPEVAFRPSLGVEIAGLPRAGFATALAVVLGWRIARLELVGIYATPRVTERTAGAGAVLQLAAVAVRGCGRLVPSRWIELPLCAGVELGAVLGRGIGVSTPRRDHVLWAAALLGPGLVIRAHRRLGVVIEGHVAFPLGRPSFALDPFGTVWKGRIGGRAFVGLEVWLGR
jgi:hypothetical protein